MCKDPVVEEVRAARQRIAAECDYDLHKMLERGHAVVKRWQGKIARAGDLAKRPKAPQESKT